MARFSTDGTAAQNARWLAELSDALEQAHDLIWRLDSARTHDARTLDLSARVEAARAQVRLLRFSPEIGENSPPEWTSSLLWPAGSEALAPG